MTTLGGAGLMFDILRANGTTTVEATILLLFTLTFGWIAVSFWTAVIGFVLRALDLDPLTLRRGGRPERGSRRPIMSRTAVVMPIYNEDTASVLGGLEATYRSLAATGALEAFDFYILSDTNRPEVAAAEERGWAALQRRLGAEDRLFYRRRERNVGRKAGNIAEFCCRWGRHYDHMVVLDADSVMTGDTIVALVRAMQATPRAGIIQTVPIPAGQDTPFGRFTQFAARLSSPMLATGLAFWQTTEANYWGHNAIIRIAPFVSHCGLPALPGEAPLGGEILSHDFVEAALMRRGGWTVHLLPDLEGSYEGLPGNVLDFAKRDRRWAQGNLQHLKLLTTRGLHWLSRMHFTMGAMAYVSSLFWLLLLVLSTTDALARALVPHDFFSSGYQLFPNWPEARDGQISSLLALTIGMLLLPKALAVVLCLFDRARRRRFGGALRVVAGSIAEVVFSVLIAPLMMLLHALFVVWILGGDSTGWGPQSRDGRNVSLAEAARHAAGPTALGLSWGAVTWLAAPQFFWWLTPVLAGLVLSIPMVWWSSRPGAGRVLRRLGVFVTPEEVAPQPELVQARRASEAAAAWLAHDAESTPAPSPALPKEILQDMHPQSLGGVFGRRHGGGVGQPSRA